MRSLSSIFCLAAFTTLAVAAPQKPVIRDRITPEELEARRAKSQLPYKALEGAGVKKTEVEVKEADEVADLLARSMFLSDGRRCTILPAGAVIHVPAAKEGQVSRSAPNLPMVPWSEFMRGNSSWIREFGLDSEQVTGAKPFEPKVAQALGGSGSLVVATYLNQPVAPVSAVKAAFDKALEETKK